MKEVVIKLMKKALKEKGVGLSNKEIEKFIEVPSNPEFGDYAFPCFFLSEKLKDNPSQIAIELREKIGEPPATDLEDVQTRGPYINFFMNRKSLARRVVWDIITKKKNYGKSDAGKRKKVVVEFSSPNIAKPFGIGHLRSTIIGNSIANILEFRGFKAIRINYLGDWGTQFGKLIVGYEEFGSEKKLEKDPIKHLLDIYVKANKKKYEEKAREAFKALEQGNRKLLMLWKIFRNLSIAEFKKLYKQLGIKFDLIDGESNYNKKTKGILSELDKKGLLKKSKKAYIVDLSKHGLNVALVEKSDGTTLYATRDLAVAIDRYKKYGFEKMIYEVGKEQELYFRQLFKILELMGYSWAKNCIHVYHGHYLSKSGKKLSTRKGNMFFMEDVLKETCSLAEKEIKKRTKKSKRGSEREIKIRKKISKNEMKERAMKIATAAIFYGDLKNNRINNIVFDIKKFSSFDGNTGPYLLYSYARAGSIMRNAPPEQKKFEVPELEEKEIGLIKKLSCFPEVVLNAAQALNPSIIANYSYQLSQLFNDFYQNCKVIGSEQEAFRLALVQSFRQVLKNSLKLLGIETIEEM